MASSLPAVPHNPPVLHHQHPAAARRERRIWGDDEEGSRPSRVARSNSRSGSRRPSGHRGSGRSSGEDQVGGAPYAAMATRCCSRETAGVMCDAVARPRFQLPRAVQRVVMPGELERHRTSRRSHRRQQMEGLEDDADPPLPSAGETVLVERRKILASDADRAAARPLEPRKHGHQRGFSASGGSEQCNAFATRDLKIDPAQDLDPAAAGAERQRDMRSVDNVGAGHEGEEDPMLRMSYGAAKQLVYALLLIMSMATADAAAAKDVQILAFGDSLTAGYGLPPDQGFAPQLEAMLRRHGARAFVANAGVSGNPAAQVGHGSNGHSATEAEARPRHRRAGANDMLRVCPAPDPRGSRG